MVFVWSDDLALLLADAGDATVTQLQHWITSPVGYRLSEGEDPLALARRLLADDSSTGAHRRAS